MYAESFFGDEPAIFGKLFQRAADHLDACREAVDRFHQVKLENAIIIDIPLSFQLIKNSGSEFPLLAKKEFTEAFKSVDGPYIQPDIKSCLPHE